MKRTITTLSLFAFFIAADAQQAMTPEMLAQMGKVSTLGITKDKKSIVFSVRKYSVADNKATSKKYIMPVGGGAPAEIENTDDILVNDRMSPDGKYSISSNDVKVKKV